MLSSLCFLNDTTSIIHLLSYYFVENAKVLAGKSAKPETINKLTWIILTHHQDISHIQVIKVFHSGYHYHVEACIGLPVDTTLSKASEISSSLEQKLENLVEIDHAVIRTRLHGQKLQS